MDDEMTLQDCCDIFNVKGYSAILEDEQLSGFERHDPDETEN